MKQKIVSINSESIIKDAVDLVNHHNLSQFPILESEKNDENITSREIQKYITDNPELVNVNVMLAKDLPFPKIEKNRDIKTSFNLSSNYPAVLLKENNNFVGIISDADFLKLT